MSNHVFSGIGSKDVNAMLQDVRNEHDSILTLIVRRHLAENLRPVIALLNMIEGVSEASAPPKQRGEPLKNQATGKLQSKMDQRLM